MKMNKVFLIALVLVLAIALSACASGAKPVAASEEMVVDKVKKEVIIPAEVNGKYFTEGTRHGVVFKDGSNGEKAVLRGLSSEKEFHDALVAIGAKPGNNVTMENMKADATNGVSVDGSKLNVFVTWEGSNKEIPFADIIKATEKRPMDIRFGGNLENAKEYNTGCILCLDSCAVGITSDAAYPTGTTQNKVVDFNGDETVLPKDGTKVSVIFRLAE
jgi:hypothetical protein